ncbi:glycosyltransferase family 4 protein [Neobacillus sp. MM2021_6]|uniref:glycosyltransferase family 4 protein n=1 Tax=Bacillaceae TaxID=186817 RepID=UPI00140C2C4C|nr:MULTISPECIES: glycosyltransferase family 4 protein [Bacillaceae]MBO0958858.1 glycosyltransferase family 4 protein [Neobacillus sp. MM2021_6]NHC21315.1 glycosyltransferase family 4 protein [Bacillus sp. MM2020_4]
MKKKVLFCATVDYHFKAFHLPYLKWFKEQGWEVHVAASGEIHLPFVDRKFTIPIQRSPFKKANIEAFKKLKSVIDKFKYNIIHCHTPMGGVLTRLAAKAARKNGTKVLYTAHGFHFCKGAPLQNWILYYPIERLLSRYTDCLITINQEDFHLAREHRFKSQQIQHIHGVGVNTEVFRPVAVNEKNRLREVQGYKSDDFLMVYAAEFNKNKNHRLLIESIARLKEEYPNARLLLAGEGPLLQECLNLAHSLDVEQKVDFLGYRNDVEVLLKMSDIAVASSLREGLPVNIMEAMSCGLPVIANDNRGHRELIQNNQNGWIIMNNAADFSERMKILADNSELRMEMGQYGRNEILIRYSIYKVLEEKSMIYRSLMDIKEDMVWAVH